MTDSRYDLLKRGPGSLSQMQKDGDTLRSKTLQKSYACITTDHSMQTSPVHLTRSSHLRCTEPGRECVHTLYTCTVGPSHSYRDNSGCFGASLNLLLCRLRCHTELNQFEALQGIPYASREWVATPDQLWSSSRRYSQSAGRESTLWRGAVRERASEKELREGVWPRESAGGLALRFMGS